MRALILVGLGLSIGCRAQASVIDIFAANRGFVDACSACIPFYGDNGADPSNNYFAGYQSSPQPFGGPILFLARNWFDFAVPVLTNQTLISARLLLYELRFGHTGGPLTFSVYGLAGRPALFTDVITSVPFGVTTTNSVNSDTTIELLLNGAALAAIVGAQGGHVFLGGIGSGESNWPSSTSAYDFAASQSTDSILELTTIASVPEPVTSLLLGAGMVVLAELRRRRRLPG